MSAGVRASITLSASIRHRLEERREHSGRSLSEEIEAQLRRALDQADGDEMLSPCDRRAATLGTSGNLTHMTDPEGEAERLAEIVSYAASERAPPQYHPDWRTTREWTVKEIRLLLAIIESRDAEIAALRARIEDLKRGHAELRADNERMRGVVDAAQRLRRVWLRRKYGGPANETFHAEVLLGKAIAALASPQPDTAPPRPAWLKNVHIAKAHDEKGRVIGVTLSALVLTDDVALLPDTFAEAARCVISCSSSASAPQPDAVTPETLLQGGRAHVPSEGANRG